MAYSDTEICNLALAELPEKSIASLDEASIQARECKRLYKTALQELFEAHPWSFATTRLALAQIANDREGEWSFAYAVPNSMAMLRKVVFVPTAAAGDFIPLVGQTFAPVGAILLDRAPAQPFILAGSTIYTDVEAAVIEYMPVGAEAVFPALFVKALYFELASRLCTPLSKQADKRRELMGQAELYRQRAQAADLNRQPNPYDPFPESLRNLS